jgi:hypothetical protein
LVVSGPLAGGEEKRLGLFRAVRDENLTRIKGELLGGSKP